MLWNYMATKYRRDWDYVKQTFDHTIIYSAPYAPYKYHSDGAYYQAYESSRIGSTNPWWRHQVKNHVNATTTLLGSDKHIRRKTEGEMLFRSYGVFPGWTEDTTILVTGRQVGLPNTSAFFPYTPALSYPTADSKALSKFYSKVRSAQATAQAGVMMGEIRETVALLRNPVRALSSEISGYIKNVKKRTKRASTRKAVQRAVSGSWLEFQFGVRPLLKDIDDIAHALGDMQYRDEFVSVRSEGVEELVRSMTNNPSSVGPFPLLVTVRAIEKGTVRYYGVCHRQSGGGAAQLTQSLGLGMQDFLPTIYELIPWSFLVDYFSNLGDIVNAISTCTSGINWVSRTIRGSVKTDCVGVINYAKFSADNPLTTNIKSVSATGNPGMVQFEESSVSRSPLSPNSLPLPALVFKSPLGKPIKLLNIGALLTQAVSAVTNLSPSIRR